MKKTPTLITCIILTLTLTLMVCGCTSSATAVSDPGNADTSDTGTTTEAESTYTPSLPTAEEMSEIFVQKIDGLPDDFIMGMDVSSLLSQEASGVTYKDESGAEQDLLKILADSGINCIRVRVWVDPFDKDGHGYGGGNCTAETAAEIGKRAAKYGMSTCVDFHYSDFWADPKKQMVPKSWADLDLESKAAALSDYTKESLKTIIDAGANVTMVQVGNEINNAMSGEKGLNNKLKLVKAGCNAVRDISSETGRNISVVLHYTQIDDEKNIMEIARQLNAAKVDYDVFGVSYYPYWHGSLENMQTVLKEISDTYAVKTCIMETSYPYTTEDGDGTGNSVDGTSLKNKYPVSIQGQANVVRDIMAYAVSAGSIGLFYWEGAWTPVGSDYTANQAIWEQYGSGWASSYATEYDPADAGKYYGGSSWDNQAMFDHNGNKLPSLDVFRYVRYGAKGEALEITTALDDPDIIKVDVSIGAEVKMPETLDVVYNDTSITSPLKLTWDESEITAIDTSNAGQYSVTCKAKSDALPDKEFTIKGLVNVANINYIVNPGFEEDKVGSPWNSFSDSGSAPVDIQDKEADAHEGTKAFHYYKAADFSFDMQQEISDIPAGKYKLTAYIQGGDMGSAENIIMYISNGENKQEVTAPKLDGWQQWKEIVISDIEINEGDIVTVGFHVESSGGGWGTIDDFDLSLQN